MVVKKKSFRESMREQAVISNGEMVMLWTTMQITLIIALAAIIIIIAHIS